VKMSNDDLSFAIRRSIVAGSMAGCAVDLTLYPLDTIKTRLQSSSLTRLGQKSIFSSLYSGVGSVLIGSAPSSALFFTAYDLCKRQLTPLMATEEQLFRCHMISACVGEITACLIRVPVEVIKQRAQVHSGLQLLSIAKGTISNEGIRGLYRGYLATVAREIPFSTIQFPLWEYFKRSLAARQGSDVRPWQGALCGSLAGGIAACITTPFDVAKTRIMLAHFKHTDATHNSFSMILKIARSEGISKLYSGVVPRTTWMSIGGLIYFGAFEFIVSIFNKTHV